MLIHLRNLVSKVRAFHFEFTNAFIQIIVKEIIVKEISCGI